MDKTLLGIMVIGFLFLGFMVFNQTPENREKDAVTEAALVFGRIRDRADQAQRGFDFYEQAKDPRDRNKGTLRVIGDSLQDSLNELRSRNDWYNSIFNKNHPDYERIGMQMTATRQRIAVELGKPEPDVDKSMLIGHPLRPAYEKPKTVDTHVVNNYITHDQRTWVEGSREQRNWSDARNWTDSRVTTTSEDYSVGPQSLSQIDSRTHMNTQKDNRAWTTGAQTLTEGHKVNIGGDKFAVKNDVKGGTTVNEANSFLSLTGKPVSVTPGGPDFGAFTPPILNPFDPPPPQPPYSGAARVLNYGTQLNGPQIPLSGAAKRDALLTNDILAAKPTTPVTPPAIPKPQPIPSGFGQIDIPSQNVSAPVEDVHAGDLQGGSSMIPPEVDTTMKVINQKKRSGRDADLPPRTRPPSDVKKSKTKTTAVITYEQIKDKRPRPEVNLDPSAQPPTKKPASTKTSVLKPSMDSAPRDLPQNRRRGRNTGPPPAVKPPSEKMVQYDTVLKGKATLVKESAAAIKGSKESTANKKYMIEDFWKKYFDLRTTVPSTIEIRPKDSGKSTIVLQPEMKEFFTRVNQNKDGNLDRPVVLGKETVETLNNLLKHYGTTQAEIKDTSPEYLQWLQEMQDVNNDYVYIRRLEGE